MLDKSLLIRRCVEAGHRANFRVGERRDDSPQVGRFGAHIAIVDDQIFVLRFVGEACELRDFVVGCDPAGAEQHTNLALREVAHHLLNHRQYWIGAVPHTKQNFVFRVVLPAEADQILIGVRIESPHRLQNAYRRRKTGGSSPWSRGDDKKTPGAVNGDQVINKRNCSDQKKRRVQEPGDHQTSR